MPTRAEQKEQRRQLILFKALELFVKKGYADTKISDIAKASNMSMGLMFHYFESKEQLYEALIRMGAAYSNYPSQTPDAEPVPPPPKGNLKKPTDTSEYSPMDYFENFLSMLFQYVAEQPWVFYMFVFMAQARRNENIPEQIRAVAMDIHQIEYSATLIKEGQKQGIFREGDPYRLSFTFWSCVQGIMEQLATTSDSTTNAADMLPQVDWLLDIIRA